MEKKAELTTKQLVTIIILIVSFSVILLLIFRLNLGETTDKEICRNSVILKAQSGLISGPLDCRTNYLCISGGGKCQGINPTITLDVEPKNEKEIIKAIAEEMSDCWSVFGEGKVEYISAGAFEKRACAVCSIVAFDKRIQEEFPEINYEKLYTYLNGKQKDSSQTYLKYLYQSNGLSSFNNDFYIDGYLENSLESDKTYFILTGMAKKGFLSPPWNPFNLESDPLPIIILEKTKENYDAVGCDEFITKA